MKATMLYMAGVDPYTVHDEEALEYHLTQGWVTDPKLVVETPAAPAAPAAPAPVIPAAPAPCGGCVSRDAQITKLREELALATAPKPTAPKPVDKPNITDEDRLEAIKIAVQAVPKDKWQRASGGRPEMPLLADVAALTGFSVVSKEVIAALPAA